MAKQFPNYTSPVFLWGTSIDHTLAVVSKLTKLVKSSKPLAVLRSRQARDVGQRFKNSWFRERQALT